MLMCLWHTAQSDVHCEHNSRRCVVLGELTVVRSVAVSGTDRSSLPLSLSVFLLPPLLNQSESRMMLQYVRVFLVAVGVFAKFLLFSLVLASAAPDFFIVSFWPPIVTSPAERVCPDRRANGISRIACFCVVRFQKILSQARSTGRYARERTA